MPDATVVAAIIAAGPATVASLAAWRSAKMTHAEVRTNHGKRNGQYIEELAAWADFHTGQDAEQFAELREALGLGPRPFTKRPPLVEGG